MRDEKRINHEIGVIKEKCNKIKDEIGKEYRETGTLDVEKLSRLEHKKRELQTAIIYLKWVLK